jgi:hypothetical protein
MDRSGGFTPTFGGINPPLRPTHDHLFEIPASKFAELNKKVELTVPKYNLNRGINYVSEKADEFAAAVS